MLPSPRLALAVALLAVFPMWQFITSHVAVERNCRCAVSADAEFRMIQDLPVLENYDVLTSLDALSQPVAQPGSVPERN